MNYKKSLTVLKSSFLFVFKPFYQSITGRFFNINDIEAFYYMQENKFPSKEILLSGFAFYKSEKYMSLIEVYEYMKIKDLFNKQQNNKYEQLLKECNFYKDLLNSQSEFILRECSYNMNQIEFPYENIPIDYEDAFKRSIKNTSIQAINTINHLQYFETSFKDNSFSHIKNYKVFKDVSFSKRFENFDCFLNKEKFNKLRNKN